MLEMPDHSTSKLPDRIATTASLPAAGNGSADIADTAVEPVDVSDTRVESVEVPDAQDEPVPVPSKKKSRSAQRKRIALEVAGTPTERVSSTDAAEGVAEDGKPADTGDSPERES
jgi:hypothetical protein